MDIFDKIIKKTDDVREVISKGINSKEKICLTYLNQHCFNIYNANSEYRKHLDNTFQVFIDGIGIYFTLKLFGYRKVERFNATDMNLQIFSLFSEIRSRLFIVGGKFDKNFIKEKLVENKINIVGYQDGFFDDYDLPSVIKKIKSSSPQVIIVGMGVPNQEFFAAELKRILDNILIICVGNFLEFYFGTKRRAPKIFRYSGFEWLFRLITEPARLWKRYLVGIPLFFYNILKMKLSFK